MSATAATVPAQGLEAGAASALSRTRMNVVFATILLGMLLSALDATIVSTALPTIVGELGGSGHMSWVVTAYLLAETISTVLAGKFGDQFGRKRLFQVSVLIFVVGSFFCGLANSLTLLIAMRAVQGIGGGVASTIEGAVMAIPNFRLDQQTALVTGAGSGIGRGIAVGLAGAGADVACFDLPGAAIDEVCGEIEAVGQRAVAIAGDVTDPDSLSEAVQQAQSGLGPLSLAVNSAGIANAAPAEEMSPSQWQRVIDINLTGVFLSCQAEGRAMLEHGRGAIVNIASMSGTIVNRGLLQAHYNASKAAVAHLTKSLAMEWADRSIRVNAISPGYTATPMNLRPEVAEQVATFERDTPLGRMATVDELIGPAIFLLSDAASFCTGVDLLVDGGFTCW